jgi:hypothetical protein
VRALHLEQPPIVFLTPPHEGRLPRTGSLASIAPASLDLLAITALESGKGLIIRVRETMGRATPVTFIWQGKPIRLGTIEGGKIASWKIRPQHGKWVATLESRACD